MAEYAVRASSWGTLFDCAYKFEGVHILKIAAPSSPRALLGNAVHHGTAINDQGLIDGRPVPIEDVAQATIDFLRDPGFDVDWQGGRDLTPSRAEHIAMQLVSLYVTEVAPRYEFISVEMPVEPMAIDCGGGVTLLLTGTLDRARVVRDEHDRVGLSDVKTGIAAVANGVAKTAPHRAQAGTYEILYQHTTGLVLDAPFEIIGLSTGSKPEYGFGTITGAQELMLGNSEYPGLIDIGANMFRSGLFPPNPQSFTCSERYCPRWSTCPYHE